MNAPSATKLHLRANSRPWINAFILALGVLLGSVSAFAQGTPAPYTVPQYFDANGDPLASGGICTFEAGTSTLATTYTTSLLNVAQTNPIRLNAAGRPTASGATVGIWLSPGRSYKLVLKDATVTTCSPDTGVTLWSIDNVQAVPGSSSTLDASGVAGEAIAAGEVVYLSTGDGGTNAGQWYKADSDNTNKSTSTFQIGVAPGAIASGATGSIRLAGSVTVVGPLSTGSAYYVGATAGEMVITPPTNAIRIGQAESSTSILVGNNAAPVGPRGPPCGRLTLTSGLPVTPTDVTAATTLYYTPAGSCNSIFLYNGTNWAEYAFAELSIAVPATTNQMYDVFAYDNAGVVALELTSWTNDTTRATALVMQNGVWSKTGVLTRRWLGSFRTTGVSGQTEDSISKRFVYNYYNRVPRVLRRVETTASWVYSGVFRQADGDTANQVEIVNGFAETTITLSVTVSVNQSTASQPAGIGIGEDSTSAIASGFSGGASNLVSASYIMLVGHLTKVPTAGYHFYAWLESSTDITTTWYGTSLVANGAASGLNGWVTQ